MNTAIILAGGLGTRLRSEVIGLPKPMAPVQGKPFLEFLVNNCINQGITNLIISVGYLHEIISRYFGDSWHGCKMKYHVEYSPLGTGGGILDVLQHNPQLNTPFLVLNGDTFFDISFKEFLLRHQQKKADISLSLFSSSDINRYMGVEINHTGRIRALDCKKKSGECLVNGGIYIIEPLVLRSIVSPAATFLSWENDLLPKLLKYKTRLYGHLFKDSSFIDIGTPTDYRRAQSLSFLNKFTNV